MKKILQSRKNLSWMLKAVTLLAFAGVLFAGLVPVPQFAEHVAHFWPDYEDFATAAVIYVNVGFVPFYGALVLAWQVFSAIGRDESFTRANARRVRVASWLALAEVAYLLGGLIWFGTRQALAAVTVLAVLGLTLLGLHLMYGRPLAELFVSRGVQTAALVIVNSILVNLLYSSPLTALVNRMFFRNGTRAGARRRGTLG